MGVASIRDAFNAAAAGKAQAERAFHQYFHDHDAETQSLTFQGHFENGKEFTFTTGRLKPGTEMIEAARQAAADFIAQQQREPAHDP